MSSRKIKKKDKQKIDDIIKTRIKNTNSKLKDNNSSSISDSSLFDNINFSEIFNPNDKYINSGNKTSYNLMSYNLGIFNSLSTICENLNISYEKVFNKDLNSSYKLNLTKKENDNNENIINESNNKENIFTDSIIKMLLSEDSSAKTKRNKSGIKKSTIKKLNNSGISLNETEIDELLKDYFPMELDKNN